MLILIFTLVIPLIRFNQAEGLIKEGKYDEALKICSELGDFSSSKTHMQVLTAINAIEKENYNSGIKEILRAGIPVTVKYTLGGGDFSGTDYIRADEIINASPASLVVRNGEDITDTPAASAIEEFTYTKAKEFNGIKAPGRNGYRFVGWERGDVIYTAGESVSISLQAKWSDKEYALTYNLGGGSFGFAPKDYYSPEDDSFVLVKPTRVGYTFIGWTGGGYTVPTETVTIEKGSYGDREYIAHYRANTYTVTLDLDGGSLSDTTLLATYDEILTLPTPMRVGYNFTGWYNATERYISGFWRVADNITLKAIWSPNSYDVKLEGIVA
ncbi:MAG: InlB B-repeat-containing protein, partial [Clostridia bacterium]|nr:InlB B-repeat-containing protein [Clostridia bacterium]